MNSLHFKILSGHQAREFSIQLAQLRIKVFKHYPYLYDGSLEYEREYLQSYFNCRHSRIILCFDGEKVVGASTVIPLENETENIKKPFIEKGLTISDYVYFGESVLEPQYRGQGIGKKFFELRKNWSYQLQDASWAVFCAVIRSEEKHPQPTNYSPLNSFWIKQGFQEWTGMKCSLSWKCVGEALDSVHELQFWRHQLKGKK